MAAITSVASPVTLLRRRFGNKKLCPSPRRRKPGQSPRLRTSRANLLAARVEHRRKEAQTERPSSFQPSSSLLVTRASRQAHDTTATPHPSKPRNGSSGRGRLLIASLRREDPTSRAQTELTKWVWDGRAEQIRGRRRRSQFRKTHQTPIHVFFRVRHLELRHDLIPRRGYVGSSPRARSLAKENNSQFRDRQRINHTSASLAKN